MPADATLSPFFGDFFSLFPFTEWYDESQPPFRFMREFGVTVTLLTHALVFISSSLVLLIPFIPHPYLHIFVIENVTDLPP